MLTKYPLYLVAPLPNGVVTSCLRCPRPNRNCPGNCTWKIGAAIHIYGSVLLFRSVVSSTFLIMASSLDDITWDNLLQQGVVNSPSKNFQRPNSQPMARTSVSDTVKLSEPREWFQNKSVKAARLTASPRRHSNIQNLSSTVPSEPHLSPSREQPPSAYVTRSEVLQIMRGITDKLGGLQSALDRLNDLQEELVELGMLRTPTNKWQVCMDFERLWTGGTCCKTSKYVNSVWFEYMY